MQQDKLFQQEPTAISMGVNHCKWDINFWGLLVEQMTFIWVDPWLTMILSASKLDHLGNQRNLLRFQNFNLEILSLDKPLNFITRTKLFYHKFWFHQKKTCWNHFDMTKFCNFDWCNWNLHDKKTIKHVIHIPFCMHCHSHPFLNVRHSHPLLGVVAQWVQGLKWISPRVWVPCLFYPSRISF